MAGTPGVVACANWPCARVHTARRLYEVGLRVADAMASILAILTIKMTCSPCPSCISSYYFSNNSQVLPSLRVKLLPPCAAPNPARRRAGWLWRIGAKDSRMLHRSGAPTITFASPRQSATHTSARARSAEQPRTPGAFANDARVALAASKAFGTHIEPILRSLDGKKCL